MYRLSINILYVQNKVNLIANMLMDAQLYEGIFCIQKVVCCRGFDERKSKNIVSFCGEFVL